MPNREEIAKRVSAGITPREAELWLAEECEHAASLLRKEESTSVEAAIKGINSMRAMLATIEKAITMGYVKPKLAR